MLSLGLWSANLLVALVLGLPSAGTGGHIQLRLGAACGQLFPEDELKPARLISFVN